MNEKATVSVIIVNYNAVSHLRDCVNSVFNTQFESYEVIVVDNGSTDGSIELLETLSKEREEFTFIKNEQNVGPAVGLNQAIKKAKGRYIATLGNDTQVDSKWLQEAISIFESDPKVGAIQCKLIMMHTDSLIDCIGEYLGQYGFLVHRVEFGEIKDTGQFDYVTQIFAAKSAGMVVRRDVLDQIGGFDEDYFIYLEETDLCWRIWLQGYKVLFAPLSVVYHDSATTSRILPQKRSRYLVKFHGTKNYIQTLIKNLDVKNLLRILPIHIALWVAMISVFSLRGRFYEAKCVFEGIIWNVKSCRKVLAKRKIVKSQRKVTDAELFPTILRRKPLRYYVNKSRKW